MSSKKVNVNSKTQANTEVAQFPANAEMEYERSQLEIPVYKNGELQETITLTAFLKMDRGEPYTNPYGHRQFEFQIEEWEVAGHCESLGGTVNFTLTEGPQPRSICLSNNRGSDYPAAIIYNAIFDVYLDDQLVLPRQTGLGVGMGVEEIPPRVHVDYQKNLTMGEWTFAAGSCVAMTSLTQTEYEAEVAKIQAIRAG